MGSTLIPFILTLSTGQALHHIRSICAVSCSYRTLHCVPLSITAVKIYLLRIYLSNECTLVMIGNLEVVQIRPTKYHFVGQLHAIVI